MALSEQTLRFELAAPPEQVGAWLERSATLRRLVPPHLPLEPAGGDGAGEAWCASHGGANLRWHPLSVLPGGSDRACVIEQRVEVELPRGPFSRAATGVAQKAVERAARWRELRLRGDWARLGCVRRDSRLRVAVAGAGGMIGTQLDLLLRSGGHEVHRLVRRPARPDANEIAWLPESGQIDAAALEGFDAVVHLGGAGIADARWTPARKALIRSSRVVSTELLARTLAGLRERPRAFICASAVGYYGDRGEEVVDEDSAPGEGFDAELCRDWEAATKPASRAGVRVVNLRIGMVLSPLGGALAQMAPVFRLGFGGTLGSGRQYVSWITLDDLLGVILLAIGRDALAGGVNAVAPGAVTNREFTRVLGRVLSRPTFFSVPSLAVKLLLGEMGQRLLLEGARVRPGRLEAAGFEFRWAELEAGLRFELARW